MFMCQRDSFLQELDTEIVQIDQMIDLDSLTNSLSLNPKLFQEDKSLFKVVLADTVFFPEGGGQPDDHGVITKKAESQENIVVEGSVIRVIRNGTVAEHYVALAKGGENGGLSKGDKVTTKIDWGRRFDHMQQHSGQHLITAVADVKFGFPTTSWWLGSEESYIEMDTKEITPEQIRAIEDEVNARIRENVPVYVDVVSLDDPKLQTARGRNLPEDVKGNIRIVSMAGIESNVCCGTHVSNLSQLQVIKLLCVVKKKGKCLLHFLAGSRVIDRFTTMFQTEQKLTDILSSSPGQLPSAGEKLNLTLKNTRKSCQCLSKDLAVLIATTFKEKYSSGVENGNKLWMHHRDFVDLDFGMALLREIGDAKKSAIILVTLKTEGTFGYFLLTGDEKVIPKAKIIEIGEELCKILDGKGSYQKGNIYQAKVNKINGLVKAQKLAQQLVDKLFDKVEN
ncbi:alanyl-tRNA editing protein Aarsd1-B [Folsomia candida]|uniref:alanyl-tRNA editing protein Aarsd1-B n=1 Tax=Folsomia candida TaxID=158441 RepID=UPI000B90819C|nr:alanyl-tRNA editing protein Aarsd1-B [Folsomia candida]